MPALEALRRRKKDSYGQPGFTGANHNQSNSTILIHQTSCVSPTRKCLSSLLSFWCRCPQDSFSRAKSWVKELQRQGSPNIVIALAGNKCDRASERKIESSEASEYAKDNGLLFMETSAKTALNVEELFKTIAKKLPKDPYREQPEKSGGVDIDSAPSESGSSGGCCKS